MKLAVRTLGARVVVAHEELVGIGEASPLKGFSRDDEALRNEAFSAARAGLTLADGDSAVEAVERALAPLDAVLQRAPSARFALETALFDLLGQQREQSLAALLVGEEPSMEIRTNALLRAWEPDLVARAQAFVSIGFSALKVKVRATERQAFAAELSLLKSLRHALPEVALRLDANTAWRDEDARARLSSVASLGLQYVEQPTSPARLLDLGECDAAWAADESLALDGADRRLLARPAGCAAFILKPTILGGIVRCLHLARAAQARGLHAIVTHAFESTVAVAAAAELARAIGDDLAVGLAPYEALSPVPPQLRDPTRVRPSSRPGLGLSREVLGA
jgi:o-succinylbenzoate synthase